ncbi:MAG: hypothetical protein DHS20C18_06520 [Saprospiraceae bacterium]|nr:MAG: hypothetical protein DHS20C18_06520 [Saprospiraceae bacterium]
MTTEDWLESNRGNLDLEQSSHRFWFRTSMGLEDLVLAEIEDHFKPINVFKSHRNLFIELDAGPTDKVLNIRTADDVYDYLGYCDQIDHKKSSADRLKEHFTAHIAPYLIRHYSQKNIRITVSFVGKRNFNRYYVENRLNEVLVASNQVGILSNEQRDTGQAGEIRVRIHLENDRAYFGVGLQDTPLHRRLWRATKYTGQLHTPIAACMARQLTPHQQALIFDPFCGSGTLLIESALLHPGIAHLGFDLSEAAILVAGQASAMAHTRITFGKNDSLSIKPPNVDYFLLSNPPWGDKHEITSLSENFYPKLANLIRTSLGAILLLPEELIINLRQETDLKFEEIAQTRIRGKLASIVKIEVVASTQ